MSAAHPIELVVALLLALLGCAVLWLRRGTFLARGMLTAGLLLVAAAAGGVAIPYRQARSVTVLVDLSPSTRGASYRDRAMLDQRVRQLLGGVPFTLAAFSDSIQPLPETATLPDLPCQQTRFTPPAADAILLFSDGQFDPPANSPPVYAVIDPMLEQAADARVSEISTNGGNVEIHVFNSGSPRELTFQDGGRSQSMQVNSGAWTLPAGKATGPFVTAQLNSADLWPENDSLAAGTQWSVPTQRWWVGKNPPTDWTAIDPANLPADAESYLNASVIALNNISADELSQQSQTRLTQYVRDLGGGLLILGGSHAFAAGGYPGSSLESLSPLASSPPKPTMRWVVLIDSSGSMAAPWNNGTRFDAAVDAVRQLLPRLPENQSVSVGAFAGDLHWWIDNLPAATAAKTNIPPASAVPSGPTNLQAALEQLASHGSDLQTQLLLLTDADVKIDNPQTLSASLTSKKIHVSLLGLGTVDKSNPVVQLVTATDGTWVSQNDPSHWFGSLQALMKEALPAKQVMGNQNAWYGQRQILIYNRTWLRADAQALGVTKAGDPLAAQWQVGNGSVISAGFTPIPDELAAMVRQVSHRPRDPRFRVSWEHGSVQIDAAKDHGYLNNLPLRLRLLNSSDTPMIVPQVAPGRYELQLPRLSEPTVAVLQTNDQLVDRHALSTLYPREFDAIGNDIANLKTLADRSGGSLVPPTQTSPIDFAWPKSARRIDSLLATTGFALLAAGVVLRRLSTG